MAEAFLATGAALVLVADSARARLLKAPAPHAPLEEFADLANPEARSHEGDLVADSGGRRPPQGGHSAFGGDSMKRHRAEDFAAAVCARAAAALREAGALRLYIVAEPGFLGLLRRRMDRRVERCVAAEFAQSLAGGTLDQIRGALPPRL